MALAESRTKHYAEHYDWQENGLQFLFAPCAGKSVFSIAIWLPCGSIHDPVGYEGTASALSQWMQAGAGGRSARELYESFDCLGVQQGIHVGNQSTTFYATGLRDDFPTVLGLLADILLRPEFDEKELPSIIDLARQDIESVADSASESMLIGSRAFFFSESVPGYAHAVEGTLAGLEALTAESLREHWARYGRKGAAVALVADFPPDEARSLLTNAFTDWGRAAMPLPDPPVRLRVGHHHIHFASAEQTQLSLMFNAGLPEQWLVRNVMVQALGGNSSSRLFTSIREEKGLAYAVDCRALSLADRSFMNLVTATTPPRLDDMLETLSQVRHLQLTKDELLAACRSLYASAVFDREAAQSHVRALLSEWLETGSVTSLSVYRDALFSVTQEEVNAFARDDMDWQYSLVTLGREPSLLLNVNKDIH